MSPHPGSVLTRGPAAVRLRLPADAGPVAVQVLNAAGDERLRGPLRPEGPLWAAPVDATSPGLYTVLWQDARGTGSATFLVWRGGALPLPLLAAAYGGPTARPPGLGLALAAALALVGALGVLAAGARPRPVAAAALTLGALGYALDRARLAAGAGLARALGDPLFRALLLRGVALDALLAAALGLGTLLALARRGAASGPGVRTAAALALAACLGALPAVRTAGYLPALALSLGLGLWLVPRRRGRPPGTASWVGLGLAVLGAAALHPHLGRPGPAWAGALALAVAAAAAPWPRARSGIAWPALLAAAILLAPGLVRPNPGAGALALASGRWPFAAQVGGLTVRIRPLAPGPNDLEVLAPGAPGPELVLVATRLGTPTLTAEVALGRVAPGVFAASTDALSLPGTWRLAVAGRTWDVALAPEATRSCTSFVGAAARVARLGAPVLALAADPGDPHLALAATDHAVFATADGGRTWTAEPTPGPVRALAIGRYGTWWAATPDGLWSSADGGRRWSLVAPGAAVAAATAYYPSPTPLWAAVGGRLLLGSWGLGLTGATLTWSPAGGLPPETVGLAAVPGAPEALVAVARGGLWASVPAGAPWQRVLAAPVDGVTVGPGDSLWAVGPSGLYQAAGPLGPWRQVVAVGGTAVAVGGPTGATLYVARPGQGLWASEDGGATWSVAGCPVGTAQALAGTFWPGQAAPPGGPALYVADGRGDVAAVLPTGA